MKELTSLIDNILILQDDFEKETIIHLQNKKELSKKITEVTEEVSQVKIDLDEFNDAINNMAKSTSEGGVEEETVQLSASISDLEREIEIIGKQISEFETEITQKKTEYTILVNKIEVMRTEKEELEDINVQKQEAQSKVREEGIKLKKEQVKLLRIRKQVEKQEQTKESLETILRVVDLIEHVLKKHTSLASEEIDELPPAATTEIQELIISAKTAFEEAQTKFTSTDLTPFLIDADKAFKLGVKAFILLSEKIPQIVLEQSFSDQIYTIVNQGLVLNTRHLSAVESMLQRLEKGVEIAPLASFANEVQEYFSDNLSLLRII